LYTSHFAEQIQARFWQNTGGDSVEPPFEPSGIEIEVGIGFKRRGDQFWLSIYLDVQYVTARRDGI
jgi:hypothetical protein